MSRKPALLKHVSWEVDLHGEPRLGIKQFDASMMQGGDRPNQAQT